MNNRRNAVITGIGIVSPAGIGHEDHWRNVRAGLNFVGDLRDDDEYRPFRYGGRVGEVAPPPGCNLKMVRNLNLANRFAVRAAELALQDALIGSGNNPEKSGVFFVNGLGQLEAEQLEETVRYCNVDGRFSYNLMGSKGIKLINPILPVRSLPNIGLGMMAIIFGFKGANLVVSPFESETAMLIDEACQAITEGLIDLCLVGGADAPFGVGVMGSLIWQVRQWETASNRFVAPELRLAEGAAFLVIEAEEHAVARGRSIYGRIGQAVSVNSCRPEDTYEQVAEAYRAVVAKQLANAGCDAVLMAERDFGCFQQVETDFWDNFKPETMNPPRRLASYHQNTGYLVSAGQMLDICHACLMLTEQAAKLNAVLINGQSLSGGISSIIVQGV